MIITINLFYTNVFYSWLGAGTGTDAGFPAWYTFDSMYVFALGLRNLLDQGYAIDDITNEMCILCFIFNTTVTIICDKK